MILLHVHFCQQKTMSLGIWFNYPASGLYLANNASHRPGPFATDPAIRSLFISLLGC